jgi:hypothetical protein
MNKQCNLLCNVSAAMLNVYEIVLAVYGIVQDVFRIVVNVMSIVGYLWGSAMQMSLDYVICSVRNILRGGGRVNF